MKKIYFAVFLIYTTAVQAQLISVDKALVIVDENVILFSELHQRINDITESVAQSGQQLPPIETLSKLVLDRLIDERLQLNLSVRMGVELDQQQIEDAVATVAQQKGVTVEEFYQSAEQNGMPRQRLQRQMADELVINEVQQYFVNERISITEAEVNRFLASKEGQFWKEPDLQLSQIVLPADAESLKTMEQVLEKLLQNQDFNSLAITYSKGPTALRGGVIGWRKALQFPEEIAKEINKLEVGQHSNIIQTSNAIFLFKLFDKKKSVQKQTVEQTKARHILIRPTEIRTEEQAHNLVTTIATKIESLDDFILMARKYSDDYSNSMQGGDLDWVYPGQMVPDFEQEMKTTKIGVVSNPVRTDFGWHILWVESVREIDVSENIIKNQAMQLLRSRRFDEESKLWLQEIRNDAYIEHISQSTVEQAEEPPEKPKKKERSKKNRDTFNFDNRRQ